MTMRDRLIALLMTDVECDIDGHGDCSMCKHRYSDEDCFKYMSEIIADFMLAKGVIVPPCEVGGTIYVIFGQFKPYISKCRVDEFLIQENGVYAVVDIYYPNFVAKRNTSIPYTWFGRLAFLTREEAEQALKEFAK